jgi:hypothetical protein
MVQRQSSHAVMGALAVARYMPELWRYDERRGPPP